MRSQSSNSDSFSHEESVTASFLKKKINLLQNKSFFMCELHQIVLLRSGLEKDVTAYQSTDSSEQEQSVNR